MKRQFPKKGFFPSILLFPPRSLKYGSGIVSNFEKQQVMNMVSFCERPQQKSEVEKRRYKMPDG